ncbi:integrase domain-containing protein [Vibrio vulnificus]|uniref:phage integrase N-terminal domain-containing protein n=1 Tax=Vibrio vulnificus TaxID=672 RepID=UPI001A1F3990|nr:phage integrase N-terminal domain-containing protein [Vibrio vulnificus]EJR3607536.1 integrase domain-containing protein [Vibrio vulnificus]EJV9308309.1 integrase domain-containing protein [Vibrio vulnificus]ELK2254667.1 integrase domain-containing protein [Vibrio vulnificus]ELV8603036.1 integrase domain-containing protein [Vibrio vulnificus]ELV8658330.1 integrase domain-containing protein [Vibrio vulnificus]
MAKPSLRHGLVLLMRRNTDGSYASQAARSNILIQIEKQLKGGGYRHLTPHTLKLKHVKFLIEHWQSQGLSIGTIKNRMAHVRWVFEKTGREHLLPKSNEELSIGKRVFSDNTINKAKTLDVEKLNTISDPYIKTALELQSAFGLRREEALKFSPSIAIKDDRIFLKGSWTKGGKEREVPIRNEYQKRALEHAIAIAPKGSMIPAGKTYIQQLKHYESTCKQAGLCKNHGLRHQYAQTRYIELTGMKAPKAGGLTSRELSVNQKMVDKEARLIISKELGHEREEVTVIYLGR